MISGIEMSYYNKVYPTDYDIQVSDDKENWVTVKTITHENNGPTYPVDTVEDEFAVPVMARYVRLLFRSINSGAAGNCIGLQELEVTGVRRHAEMEYVSVQEMEDQTVEIGAEVLLPEFVQAAVRAEADGEETAVMVMPEWDPAEVDMSADGEVDVLGSLPYRYNLSNPQGCEIAFAVTVGAGTEEPDQPDPEDPKPEEPGTEDPDPEDPKPEEPGTEDPDPEDPKPEGPGAEEPGEDDPKAEGTGTPGTEGQNGGDGSKAVPTGDAANAGWIYAAVLSGAAAAVLYKRKRRS